MLASVSPGLGQASVVTAAIAVSVVCVGVASLKLTPNKFILLCVLLSPWVRKGISASSSPEEGISKSDAEIGSRKLR